MIRNKNRMKKPRIQIPGKELLRFVKYGIPKLNGVYFVYYKPRSPSAMNSSFPPAFFQLTTVDDGYMVTKEQVLAYIGPLPVLCLDEIEKEYIKEELNLHTYFIGTLENAINGVFKNGPYVESIYISLQKGIPGDFGFEVNQRTTLPKPISYFSKMHNKWRNLKNTSTVIKKMKTLQKQQKELRESLYKTKSTTKTHFIITTIPQILKNKVKETYESITDVLPIVPKINPLYKSYIFEITENHKLPIYVWDDGWGSLSNKKIRAIRKRIKDI